MNPGRLKIYIGDIPRSAGIREIEYILESRQVFDFSIKKSKNKGQAKVCHAVITLSNEEDYNFLLELKEIPLILKKGEILIMDPEQVAESLDFLTQQQRINSFRNEIFDGHPMFEKEYVQYLKVSTFKGKSQRTAQILERLDRRIYIDGFTPLDLDPNISEKI